jgi:hypothetical protein
MGKEKGQKKTACQDCVGLEWRWGSKRAYAFESFPDEPICMKTKREEETRFNPITGEIYQQYPHPSHVKYESIHNVNFGNCPKFEAIIGKK